MACVTLTKGRKLPCRSGSSGMKAIGIIPFEDGLLELVDGELETIPASVEKIYRYELKHTGNTFSEDINTDSDAMSTDFAGTLTVNLQKLDLDLRNEIKELTKGSVIIFIETNFEDKAILVAGSGYGIDLTGGSLQTGGAKTDFNGAVLTFTSSEIEPIGFLSAEAKTTYATLIEE